MGRGMDDTRNKIDFLMKLTDTRNAVFANALSFDASYISRIRSGKRGLPPTKPFIVPASAFFAKHVTADRQRRILAAELGVDGAWPADQHEAARLIAAWLDEEGEAKDSGVLPASGEYGVPATANAILFYGDAGRRESALAFLSELDSAGYTGVLLLQSDEDMAWMRDEAFAKEWGAPLARLLSAGCTVRVVHTVSRDAGEMWEGVHAWLPLYLEGKVEPWYYPRLRDGVRTRSLFVAPGVCALMSDAVRGQSGPELSIMLHDRRAVRALRDEFEAYLALCRPLVQRIPADDARAYADRFLSSANRMASFDAIGAIVAIRGGEALVVGANDSSVALLVEEPRLVDALSEYLQTMS